MKYRGKIFENSMIALLSLVFVIGSVTSQELFTNPIFDMKASDPFVIRVGEFYYLLASTNQDTELTVYKSQELTNFRNSESRVIFTVPINYEMVWAGEMHYQKDGELYLYVSYRVIGPGEFHRMYAMKADDPTNPMGTWGTPRRILPQWEQHTVDGTVFHHGNGKTYFVWPERDRLYISEMTDPYTVSDNRILLREPTRPWECNVLEGPFFIFNKNVSYMVFCACYTGGPDYSLALMSIDYDKDPMELSNWWYGDDGPVFWRNDEEDVFGPGHASFTTSPDGNETWMVYHAWSNNPVPNFDNRIARVEKITWGEDGKPVFPRPHGFFNPQPIPSGQQIIATKSTFTNPIINVNSADPFVRKIGEFYYLLVSTKGETQLILYKSRTLTNFRNSDSSVIFQVPEGFGNVWASEMHYMPDGELYIYFCMNRVDLGETHRAFVIKADDSTNPMGTWGPHIRMMPQWEIDAIDMTPLHYTNGRTYFVWCEKGHLYIADMVNPTTVGDTKVHLREPRSPWEGGVSEGPYFIYNGNVSYLVFSASGTFGPDYCLGLMSLDSGKDPMNTEDWWYGEDKPVFWRNDEELVYGPGHASFTTSPDDSETWMIYHASVDRNHFGGYRIARADKITWGPDGKPVFPRPSGYFKPQALPSGDI